MTGLTSQGMWAWVTGERDALDPGHNLLVSEPLSRGEAATYSHEIVTRRA